MEHLFRALKTQISPANHQQWCDHLGGKIVQRQQSGQQDDQLVFQRPLGNAVNDRQFAFCLKAVHVFGRDGGIVDNHTCRLHSGLAGRRCNVIY